VSDQSNKAVRLCTSEFESHGYKETAFMIWTQF